MITSFVRFAFQNITHWKKSLHNSVSRIVGKPFSYRTDDELQRLREDPEISGEWASLFDGTGEHYTNVIDDVRKSVGADAVLVLGIGSAGDPILIAQSRKGGRWSTKTRDVVRGLLTWDSSDFRGLLNAGSRCAMPSDDLTASIEFPSKLFPNLQRDGIRTVVLSSLPRRPKTKSHFISVIAFVNVGQRLCSDEKLRSKKNQCEEMGFSVGCELLRIADERVDACKVIVGNAAISENPEGQAKLLFELARRSQINGAPLPEEWAPKFIHAQAEAFSNVMEQYVSGYGKPSEVVSAVKNLVERAQCIRQIPYVLKSSGKKLLAEFAQITACLEEICSTTTERLPTSLDELTRRRVANRLVNGSPLLTTVQLRSRLRTYFSEYYREQEKVTATVEEVSGKFVHIAIDVPEANEFYRVPVPVQALGDEPECGDVYRLVLWDLWGHWYGIASAKKVKSANRRRSAKQRQAAIDTVRQLKLPRHGE